MEVLKKACLDGDFEAFKASTSTARKLDILFCVQTFAPDDPIWLNHCLLINPTLSLLMLRGLCIKNDKQNMVRYLVKQKGVSLDYLNRFAKYGLDGSPSVSMCRVLIDLGATKIDDAHRYHRICKESIADRNRCRHCALITLCASRCRSRYRDVLQIIARCVWSARLTEDFWFE